MPRELPSNITAALLAQETGECLIVLVTLDHDDMPAPIRVCSDGKDLISRGDRYIAFPFEISLPDELDDTVPRVSLRIDNVDQQVVTAVRTVQGSPIQCRLEVVAASDPSEVLMGPYDFSIRDVRWDAITVEGELVYKDLLTEPFPAPLMTPSRAPGIFAF
ncbi:MAG TPA: DUF1833 family protein [Phycisphaerales bacterium]|nr:DUF1833 family protein [Phycisphaerales bacterium]